MKKIFIILFISLLANNLYASPPGSPPPKHCTDAEILAGTSPDDCLMNPAGISAAYSGASSEVVDATVGAAGDTDTTHAYSKDDIHDYIDQHDSDFDGMPDYDNTVIVDQGGGGDYTTIQAAINSITDASTSNRYTVLVNPGTYAENITMKDYVNVKGTGGRLATKVTGTTGTLLTMPANEAHWSFIDLYMTPTASSDKLIDATAGGGSTGQFRIENAHLSMVSSAAITPIMIDSNASYGLFLLDDIILYNMSDTTTTADIIPIRLQSGNDRTYILRTVFNGFFGTGASDIDVIQDNSIGRTFLQPGDFNITCTNASYSGTINFFADYGGAAALPYSKQLNSITVKMAGAGSGTSYFVYKDSTSDDGDIDVSRNIFYASNFGTSYRYFIGSGDTLFSYFNRHISSLTDTKNGTLKEIDVYANDDFILSEKVGIGSTEPDAPLHIQGSDARIRLGAAGGSGDDWDIESNSSGNLVLSDNDDTASITISSVGNMSGMNQLKLGDDKHFYAGDNSDLDLWYDNGDDTIYLKSTTTASIDVSTQTGQNGSVSLTANGTGDIELSPGATGNVSIISTSQAEVLHVENDSDSLPATSGSDQTGEIVRLRGSNSNTVLDIGSYSTSGTIWIQATNSTDLSTNRKLIINPNGGEIDLGASEAVRVLPGQIDINADNLNLNIGASRDLKLYHNGSNSYIYNDTGDLYLRDPNTNGGTAITLSSLVTDATNVDAAGALMHSDLTVNGFVRRTGAGTYAACLDTFNGSSAPTANEDSGDGYCVGSTFVDTTNDKSYVCLDNTLTAAVWTETTQSGSATAWSDIGNPTANDEIDMGSYIIELNTADLRLGDGGSNYLRIWDDSGTNTVSLVGNTVFNIGTITVADEGDMLQTGTSGADYFDILAYDVDGTAYVSLFRPVAGNNVSLQLGPPTNYWSISDTGYLEPNGTAKIDLASADGSIVPEVIGIACSDESTDLTTGTAKVTFRMPYAMTVTAVRANVNTAPVGSTLTVDINESGTTILSTILSIDASEETSTTAATPAVISDSALADDAEITIDIDQIGSSTAGKGLKIWFIGTRILP